MWSPRRNRPRNVPAIVVSDYLGHNWSTRVTIVARLEASSVVERPYVLLSCGMSIDGYLDDTAQRAAAAVQRRRLRPGRRRPRRLRRDPGRRHARSARTTRGCWSARPSAAPPGRPRGEPPTPVKVTVTGRCDLDPAARFFTARRRRQAGLLRHRHARRGARAARRGGHGGRRRRPGRPAPGAPPTWPARGVRRLMVEGGGTHAHPVPHRGPGRRAAAGGGARSSSATRGRRGSSATATFPWGPKNRATLAEVRQIGDVVLLRYALSDRFAKLRWAR